MLVGARCLPHGLFQRVDDEKHRQKPAQACLFYAIGENAHPMVEIQWFLGVKPWTSSIGWCMRYRTALQRSSKQPAKEVYFFTVVWLVAVLAAAGAICIRRPNMTESSHHSYQIVLLFTLGHSYGWGKLSPFEFENKWTVHELNVHTVNLS